MKQHEEYHARNNTSENYQIKLGDYHVHSKGNKIGMDRIFS